jgi:hypothetical protein
MRMSFTKLDQSIVTSTIWCESDATLRVWITLLAMCNQYGEVQGTLPGLASLARCSLADTKAAIKIFLAPDPYSRTKEMEGRRIEIIEGGWVLINHAKYREMQNKAEKAEKARARQERYRAKKNDRSTAVVDNETTAVDKNRHKRSESVTRNALTTLVTPCHPHTDTDTDLDPDLEANSKANSHQDPDPERVTARRGVGEPASVSKEVEIPEIRELPPEASPSTPQNPLPRNLSMEIATVPPLVCGEDGQQALLNPQPDLCLIERKRQALQGRLAPDQRSALIDQAIQLYNQFRGPWGECCGLSSLGRNNLERLLLIPDRSPDEFLALIKDATLFAAQSEWHNRPDFESKHFGFLIGRSQGQDRLVDYALRWRALPESSKVGAAIKITQQTDEIKYHDLQGNPTQKTWAMGIWWKISKAAIAGEAVSNLEKDWAKYYFPNYDIYVGDEWLA